MVMMMVNQHILYHMRLHLFCLFLLFGCTSCLQNEVNGPDDNLSWETVNAFPSLSFNQPLDLQEPRGGSGRLFVAEKQGIIYSFPNDPEAPNADVFLDISDQVDDQGYEEGLLGLAFHPEFTANGYFYLNYTTGNRTHISRFSVFPDDPARADKESEKVILSYGQPHSNHNGGRITFGPDGYLYIAVGDGGGAGDPDGHGQNRETLLGSILRIDVDQPGPDEAYAIPPDNPFFGNEEGYREEIYAWGLRNPWRFSFDPETGRLWAADVGQNAWEEINLIESGGNYGWNIMEGTHCFNPPEDCNTSGLELPVLEYGRDQGISVTGGFVYRGASLPELNGQYIYGDFGSGRIWALDASDPGQPGNRELLQAPFQISSFGTDQEGELYICSFDGSIYRLTKN